MSGGFDNDPHSQDGESCPRNYFGITSYAEFKQTEAIYVPKRALELRVAGMAGAFDIGHLRKIHWYLFRDVFPWAGDLRLVGMAKVGGAPFASPAFIEPALGELFRKLASENCLTGTAPAAFVKRAAYYLGEINAIHPFREGNGRTQREFLRQLALHAGHKLSWSNLDEQRNTAASILSHLRGDNTALEWLLEEAMRGNV